MTNTEFAYGCMLFIVGFVIGLANLLTDSVVAALEYERGYDDKRQEMIVAIDKITATMDRIS